MSTESTKTPPTASAPTPSPPITRTQQRNQDERDAEDDADKTHTDHRNKPKAEPFKGKVDKMDGHVFQLSEEGRKGNQFTQTLEALYNYATLELDHVKDLAPLFATPCGKTTIAEPEDLPPFLPDKTTRVTRDHRLYLAWKHECETYNARVVALDTNLRKLFTVILMQCSQSVKMKLEASDGYTTARQDSDCTWLISTLKNICHRFEHTENRWVALVNAKASIFTYRQSQTQTVTDYFETFQELLAVLESYGGQLHDPEAAAPASANIATRGTAEERCTFMRDRYCAIIFLRNSDNHRFGPLKEQLSNSFSLGQDQYPTSLTGAHQLLLTYKNNSLTTVGGNSSGRRTPNNSSGRTEAGRHSYRGGRGGRSGRTFVQVAFCLAQIENYFPDGIPPHFILLDSDSTVSIFCNPTLLTDIHDVAEPLYLETNGGGYQVSTQMGTVKDFGLVWYNPDSIANILSLAQVRLVRRVTMDTSISPAFHVHKPDGSGTTLFAEHESGLYLYDASVTSHKSATDIANNIGTPVIDYSCLQTVAANKSKFTARQVDAADAARTLYRLIGRPGYQRFLTALKENHILNCPVTVDDATRAELIYGKDIAFLKGKTTASPAKDHVQDTAIVPLPPDMLSLHPNVTLCCDLFYVLGQGFALSTSRNLRFLSCHPIADRNKPTLAACLSADIQLYSSRGFLPTEIHADGEFHALQSSFPSIRFSICSADDHVPEIERAIRTVKESIRSTIHGMPYSRLPRTLVKELANHAIRNLNLLPSLDGVSTSLSPATIVTGQPKPDYRTLKLEFGTYVQVYDGTSNDTKSRTLGAIATNPTGNSSGDYYFMSLATGRRIHRRSWTVVPISDSTIARVEAIAFDENMPPVDSDHMINEYDPDAPVDESAYDRTYLPPPVPDADSDHALTSDAYTDTSDSDSDSDDEDDDLGHHPDFDDVADAHAPVPLSLPIAIPNEERLRTIATATPTPTPTTATEPVRNEERSHTQPIENQERSEASDPIENEERNIENEERNNTVNNEERQHGLRPKKPASFTHRFGFAQSHRPWSTTTAAIAQMDSPSHTPHNYTSKQMASLNKCITGLMFTQMSAAKGIKKHGQSALAALRKEFEQFKALDVLEPLDAFTLTEEQKAESLRALSVIKEKRDGSLKGRTCADGSTQQGKYSKRETGSPTISNDALFMTIMIDAFERRDVATADIAGAYLHAHMKDFISMRFVGWAVDLLCDVNPEYTQYIVFEGKTKVLYVRCNKAIYGCVVSGVLWYELFSDTLEKQGFTTNPYDFCVANATIEGSQCTIGWFVDDTKISHVNPLVVTRIINILEKRFGKMKVTRGAEHKFLGMDIKFLGDGTATIHMPSYIHEAISESGLNITKHAPSPCANSLLTIDSKSPLLPPSKARTFHSVVAKLIYVGTRSRTDILLALSFLCGRVSTPTEQDEKKLTRLLEYLLGTIDLTLRLGADSLNQFVTWVDASFAVHPDMRSHTGGVISFGRGGLICKSKKQNINTKSSTEAELIGASDYLPNTLFVKMFMESQGYPIDTAIFNQDNESAIKMESNGKASCGQRSRHIDIRYFFITDHAQRQSITISHCPTGDMLADFFTKPLQGVLFRKFRSVLLGEAHISSLISDTNSPSPSTTIVERVGKKNNRTGTRFGTAPTYPLTTVCSTASMNAIVNSSHSIENYPEV